MLTRSARAFTVGRRQMSALALEGPRVTIAKNILVFRKIGKSVDEASLEMAAKHSPTVDPSNLHNAIKDLEGYLSSATPAAGAAGFQKDPTAWQNMEFGAFVGAEAARDDTWPFLVGGIVTFVLLGLGIPAALSKEGKKKSKYISMIEGRHGELESDHAHGHAAHH